MSIRYERPLGSSAISQSCLSATSGGSDAFSLVPPYLRTAGDADEPVWFSEFGLEQTRPFGALKVWATLSHLGRDGVARLIGRDIAVAEHLRDAAAAA